VTRTQGEFSRGQLMRAGSDDCVERRLEFEAVYPEAVIVTPATLNDRWRAVLPPGRLPGDGTSTTIGAWSLCDLMDQLEDIYPLGRQTEAAVHAAPTSREHPGRPGCNAPAR
jgi:hypothetical protein